MTRPKVYIARKIPEQLLSPYRNQWEIEMWPYEDLPVRREELHKQMGQADAIFITLTDVVDQELIDGAKQLKIIANMAVGYDNIDIDYARKKGVIVTNTPDVLTESTADLTFALLLAASRRLIEANEYIKEGKWTTWSPLFMAGTDIHHKTLGIVGMGRIGEAVAHRAKGFHMNVLYHNRRRKPEAEEKLGAVYVGFEELLTNSDFVVCMTPLTQETKDLFNRRAFQLMKETAVFVNTSRGGTVNEEDLYQALKTGEILAAGLDVFQNEPIGKDHPLLQLDNVTALPHIGSATRDTRYQMMKLALENIDRVLQGKEAKTPVK
ncbi:MAG: D-glycerate dehydrogenase [Bacillaceae bacterium]|nr:D-glycerate dehydrogenase [Bacillaceae bacterium]